VKVAASLRVLAYTDSRAIGGAELALGYLLGALAPEIEVGVLATDKRVAEAIAARRPGTSTVIVPAPRGAHDHVALRAHAQAVRAFSPHVLHANHAWPWACAYGELAGLLAPGAGVLAVDHLPVASSVPGARRVGRRLLARRLRAHVAVGVRCAREVEEIVGLPYGSVRAIPNGVPVDRARGSSAVGVRTGSRREAGAVIGSLGRLTEQKGYDLLVRALPQLPGARLVLVGDGPERASLETLASELGVAERLRITGWVGDARSHLDGFDVFALPSAWEGMPLGILEAMHAGLPVLATDVGSVSEAVADGETGYLASAGDLEGIRERLARLLGDPGGRVRMGEQGRRVALERFTDTVMAKRYEAIYSEMTASPGRVKQEPPGSSRSAR
jgi:glycosyltransferase involved in cell wall biosynthesis